MKDYSGGRIYTCRQMEFGVFPMIWLVFFVKSELELKDYKGIS